MESAVSPGAHLCNQIGTDELFANEEPVYMGFKQLAENIFLWWSTGIEIHSALIRLLKERRLSRSYAKGAKHRILPGVAEF